MQKEKQREKRKMNEAAQLNENSTQPQFPVSLVYHPIHKKTLAHRAI